MHLREALMGRRTIHRFVPEPVDREVIDRALVAAQQAPNHRLTYPWRFTLVGSRTRESLAELGVQLKCAADADKQAREAVRKRMLTPGALLVASCRLSDEPLRQAEDRQAVACAVQNLMLSLWADGVGSKWGTGAVTRHPETYELLGIDPDGEEVVGFLWIGKPAEVPPPPKRPPLSSVFRETE